MRKNLYLGISAEGYQWKHVRCKLLQKRSIGKSKACSKHLRHIAIEKDIFTELNRCIFQISLKYIKLRIPKTLFILVLSSFNFYLKIIWTFPPPPIHPKIKVSDPPPPPALSKDFSEIFNPHPPSWKGGMGGWGCMPCVRAS